jgi:type II secretion system protein G
MTTIRNLIEARRADKEDEGGFTLIELLIVIVVLGILAAIVVFAVQNLTGTSAKSACKSDVRTVESAVEAYKAQMGVYPTTADGSALLAPATGPNGAVGPWLRNFPDNANHYTITLGVTPDAPGPPVVPGNLGQVLVSSPAQPAPTNSNAAVDPCTLVI